MGSDRKVAQAGIIANRQIVLSGIIQVDPVQVGDDSSWAGGDGSLGDEYIAFGAGSGIQAEVFIVTGCDPRDRLCVCMVEESTYIYKEKPVLHGTERFGRVLSEVD
jgi:hypothetical protein